MARVKIQGMTQVLLNLNQAIDRIEYASLMGLVKFAVKVRRDMDMSPPLIPVDMGNLRASFFIVSKYDVHRGYNTRFKGKSFEQLGDDHMAAVAEAYGIVRGIFKPTVILGFSANYALWVHENVDSGVVWSRPGSGAKFFEASLKKNTPNFIGTVGAEIIASEYLASKRKK